MYVYIYVHLKFKMLFVIYCYLLFALRVLLVRLFSYISLIGFIFIQIGCTQTPNEENQCSTDDIAIPIPGIETETCASVSYYLEIQR